MILRTRSSAAFRRYRRGFTLLEILLAALIAGLLLAALYAALYSTLLQTQATRDAVASEDLARGVFNKMSSDLTGTLAPLPPKSGGNAAASGGTVATPPAGTTPTDGSTAPPATTTDTGSAAPAATDPAATAATDPAAETAMPGATDNATAVSADFAFQGGIVGEETQLVIYAGRVPEAFGRYGSGAEQVRADQRQIIYWLESGRGLYRRERPWVTADGVRNAIEADADAPDAVLLAEEVTALTFAYTDGISGSWATSWDGTVPGPDGVTPLGPPRAIKVTLDIRVPTSKGDPVTKQVSQVIVVRSAPGTYTPPLLEAPTDAATEGTGSETTETSGTGTGTGGSTGTGSGSSGMGGGTTGGMTGGSTGGGKTGGSTGAAPSGMSGGSGTRPSGGGAPAGSSGGSGSGARPSGGSPSGSGAGAPSGGSGTGASGGKR